MKLFNKATLIMLLALVLVIAFFAAQRIRNPVCQSPLILLDWHEHNRPEAIVRRIISDLGGLPKADMDVFEAQQLLDVGGAPPVFPVAEWRIESSTAVNSGFDSFLDDDPVYLRDIVIGVTYTSGDTAVLQWSSWSYGIVACPILISMGSGPPGQLKILP